MAKSDASYYAAIEWCGSVRVGEEVFGNVYFDQRKEIDFISEFVLREGYYRNAYERFAECVSTVVHKSSICSTDFTFCLTGFQ